MRYSRILLFFGTTLFLVLTCLPTSCKREQVNEPPTLDLDGRLVRDSSGNTWRLRRETWGKESPYYLDFINPKDLPASPSVRLEHRPAATLIEL